MICNDYVLMLLCFLILRCNEKTRAVKKYSIHTLPEVLIIHFKRYDMIGRKLSHHVSFPKTLNMSEYLSAANPDSTYELSGVIDHSGLYRESGHYVAHVKNPAPIDEWVTISDRHIFHRAEKKVLLSKAQILFYERVTTKEPEGELSPSKIEKLKHAMFHEFFLDYPTLPRTRRHSYGSEDMDFYFKDKKLKIYDIYPISSECPDTFKIKEEIDRMKDEDIEDEDFEHEDDSDDYELIEDIESDEE